MQKNDELNQLLTDAEFDIDSYFNEMDLTDKEKEERKEFAKETQEMLIFIFALYLTEIQYNYKNKQYIIKRLQKEYRDIILKIMKIDEYLEEMIKTFANDIVNTTFRHEGEEYFTSEERASIIACNAANDTLNYKQYSDAVESGKKNKQWLTEKDKKVRETHKELDDMVIPINHKFLVGNTLMRFPHDTMYGVDYEQLSNCRCTIKYF